MKFAKFQGSGYVCKLLSGMYWRAVAKPRKSTKKGSPSLCSLKVPLKPLDGWQTWSLSPQDEAPGQGYRPLLWEDGGEFQSAVCTVPWTW